MSAKNRWLLGLQWGACAWLAYVVLDAGVDFYYFRINWVIREWPRFWWCAFFALFLPGWLAATWLLAAGSRYARAAVATMIVARTLVAYPHIHATEACGEGARLVIPLFLPLLPLVVLRVEEPRVVLALAALGRWREALARSGGAVALLVALAVLSTHRAAAEAMWSSPLSDTFRLTGIIVAFAAVVAWMTRKRMSLVKWVIVVIMVLLALAGVIDGLRVPW